MMLSLSEIARNNDPEQESKRRSKNLPDDRHTSSLCHEVSIGELQLQLDIHRAREGTTTILLDAPSTYPHTYTIIFWAFWFPKFLSLFSCFPYRSKERIAEDPCKTRGSSFRRCVDMLICIYFCAFIVDTADAVLVHA